MAGEAGGDVTPPTIIVVHPKEKRSKCTVEPLRGREDFVFWTFPERGPQSLEGYVRLGLGGPQLSADDAASGLLVLDGTWRLAEKMEADFEDVPVRTLPAWETAYPRISKLFEDPLGGLATIEAVYAAHHILGRDVSGLLESYYWRDEFLARNSARLSTRK
jgi:pre-rRNA-processing protein TSR3